MKEYREYQAYYEDYDYGVLWLFLILGILLLFFIINGITFSILDFSVDGGVNSIDANIIFNYSDVSGNNNGIYLENLNSVSDEIGKKFISDGSYFDFNVSGNFKNYNMQYIILVKKDDISTLQDKYAKIYLTKVEGSMEIPVSNYVNVYSNLDDIIIDGVTYKKLFTVPMSKSSNFQHNYRLRMWISNDAVDFYQKVYSLKVSVIAESVGE